MSENRTSSTGPRRLSRRCIARAPLGAALLALAASLPSCISFASDERLFVASDPPGALIRVNGTSTGLVTPALIAVSEDALVELALQGYPNELRRVRRVTHFDPPLIEDAGAATFGSSLPTDWIMEDILFPWRWLTRNEPTRIHVVFRTTDS
ncbi:MAG: hypothetical protein JNM84_22125 [Planctomycetes bacterium]|nr:hypothetical protein [Planctomycetota bacterium]